ncbi:MAG: DUF6198 family protein [Lachnospiraceae bacterium]|nr:DUF6198 family protein [Lachnospiraceae bacterium]
MEKKELFKRYLLFIAGLFFAGVGVAFTKHGELGVSPISSVANVMSCKFTAFSLGTWLIIWNCILIVCQIIILRKDFQLFQLLQIPLSVLFGWFTDFGMWLVSFIPVPNYAVKLLMLLIGIIILAFGITLSVIANVILNSGEAVVKAVSDKSGKAFGDVKVIFDITCVVIAVVLSLILFKGKIVGTREGTIISALCTGFVVKFITKGIKERVEAVVK